MRILTITSAQYNQLTENSQTLKVQHNLVAIKLSVNNEIIKHIYKRPLWSSATFSPYAKRFKRNAEHLAKLGFNVPKVKAIYRYPQKAPQKSCHILLYDYLMGNTIYETAEQGDYTHFARLPAFIARLHHSGVYFRDLHTKNLIVQPDNEFAIIDLARIKISRKPLRVYRRARNFIHFFTTKHDRPILQVYGIEKFLLEYITAAQFNTQESQKFLNLLTEAGLRGVGESDFRLGAYENTSSTLPWS